MAYNFNGSSDKIERAGAVATATPLTMACWFNAVLGDNNAMGIGSTTEGDSIVLQPWSDGVIYFTTANDSVAAFAGTSGSWSASTWTHACGVTSAANSRTVYRDGANSGTDTTSKTPTALDITTLGAINNGGNYSYFTGWLAEAAIWNAALDANEVAALAAGAAPSIIRPASLILYWPGLVGAVDRMGAAMTVSGATLAVGHPRVTHPQRSRARRLITAVGGGSTVKGRRSQGPRMGSRSYY